MDIITEEEVESVKGEIVEENKQKTEIVEKNFGEVLEKMSNPVDFQKDLATKMKQFLDRKMESEMADLGFLSETTRKWVVDYNNVLNMLHKNIHGDKSTQLNLHLVGHSSIAAKIRKHTKK
jgi:hypothetical protein